MPAHHFLADCRRYTLFTGILDLIILPVLIAVWYETTQDITSLYAAVIGTVVFAPILVALNDSVRKYRGARVTVTDESIEFWFPGPYYRWITWGIDLPCSPWIVRFGDIQDVRRKNRLWSSNKTGSLATLRIVDSSGLIYELSRPFEDKIDAILSLIQSKMQTAD